MRPRRVGIVGMIFAMLTSRLRKEAGASFARFFLAELTGRSTGGSIDITTSALGSRWVLSNQLSVLDDTLKYFDSTMPLRSDAV